MSQKDASPLVTFALISFRQIEFIAESVESVFAQNYPNLEIILSDDCSPDGTFDVIERLSANYRGPHQLVLNCNKENLGLARHINRVCELASGSIVVIGAGDDVFTSDRVQQIITVFQQNPDVYSVYSDALYIDEVGRQLPGSLGKYRKIMPGTPENVFEGRAHAYGCAHAWRKESYSKFGPLHPNVVYEDQAISMRSSLLGGIAYIDKPLVKYRMHSSNIALGRNRRTRDQFEVVYQRKIFETQQFIRDLKCFCEIAEISGFEDQKVRQASGLYTRAETRLSLLQGVLKVKQAKRIATRASLLALFVTSVVRDRSISILIVQKAFPFSINIKNWLQGPFR